MYLEEGTVPFIFDSGCSVAVSPYKDNFGGTLQPCTKTMIGLGASATVEGEGVVQWVFKDDYGVDQLIYVRVCYIPSSTVRLFSPQSYSVREGGGSFTLTKDGPTFIFASGKSLSFSYTKGSGLPTAYGKIKIGSSVLVGYLSLSSSGSLNISKSQEELLLWHSILRHYDTVNTQGLIKHGGVASK